MRKNDRTTKNTIIVSYQGVHDHACERFQCPDKPKWIMTRTVRRPGVNSDRIENVLHLCDQHLGMNLVQFLSRAETDPIIVYETVA